MNPCFWRFAAAPRSSAPLPTRNIRHLVKPRAARARVAAADYIPHSLRYGFVTEAARQNLPLADSMGAD